MLAPVEIRPLGPADAESYIALRRQGLEQHPRVFAASPEDDFTSRPAEVRARLADTVSAVVFGAFGPGLVGVIGLARQVERKRRHKAFVWGLYVPPAHRRRAVARGLLVAAIAHARAWPGVTQVQLTVSTHAPEAARLYVDLGFETWGVEPGALRVGEEDVGERHMVLGLS